MLCWQQGSDAAPLRMPIAVGADHAIALGAEVACVSYYPASAYCWRRGATIWEGTPIAGGRDFIERVFAGPEETCTTSSAGRELECWDERRAPIPFADVEGPWGEGRGLASRILRTAIAETLTEESAKRLREDLGELLGARSSSAEELWAAYRLLAGSEAGARTLLAAASGGASRLPREALFTALRQELASLREREAAAGRDAASTSRDAAENCATLRARFIALSPRKVESPSSSALQRSARTNCAAGAVALHVGKLSDRTGPCRVLRTTRLTSGR